jgi:ribosomal protein S18 acetylase RimI-like enzyme
VIAPASPRLRPGRETDGAAMAAVFVAAWRGGYRGIVPDDVIESQTVARWEPVLTAAARDPETRSVVAIDGVGAIVGFAGFGSDSSDPDPQVGYLSSLYVDPTASGAGVGGALLERTLRELADAGRTTVALWVFRDNVRARALYERYGFVADGAEHVDRRWRVPQVRYRLALPGAAVAGRTDTRTPAGDERGSKS